MPTNHESSASTVEKPKTLAISARLHAYLKMLSALDRRTMTDIAEPLLTAVVMQNKERLEQALGEPISI